ncbi:MAG: hypothetical protein ABIJ09_03650 [Pseudomonadota bacterium]
MSDEKSLGKALLGLFVTEDEEQPKGAAADVTSVDDLLKRYGADGGEPEVAASRTRSSSAGTAPAAVPLGAPIPLQGGALPLDRIFEAAGIPSEAQSQVQKAQELLKGLPVDTPLAVKKQIVETALRAFGFPLAELVDTARQEQKALDDFLAIQGGDTQQQNDADRARIEALKAEAAALEQAIQDRLGEQTQASAQVTAAKATIDEVLGFFGPGVPG